MLDVSILSRLLPRCSEVYADWFFNIEVDVLVTELKRNFPVVSNIKPVEETIDVASKELVVEPIELENKLENFSGRGVDVRFSSNEPATDVVAFVDDSAGKMEVILDVE